MTTTLTDTHRAKMDKTLKIIKSLPKPSEPRYNYIQNPHWRHWGDLFNMQDSFLGFTETEIFYSGNIEYKIIRKNSSVGSKREDVVSKNFSSPQSKWFMERQDFLKDVLRKKGLYDENVIELILHYVSFFVNKNL